MADNIDEVKRAARAALEDADAAGVALVRENERLREEITRLDSLIDSGVLAEIERLKTQLANRQAELTTYQRENERLRAPAEVDIEALSARLHDIYQKEAHRRGDVRHDDAYDALPEPTKEWDRVLARWIVEHWRPVFDPSNGLPIP